MQTHTDPTNPRGGRGRGGRGGFDGDRGYDQRGRGRGGYEEGGRGRGGYEQRGRGRGGYEEGGRGRGGYEERGRGRGGYEERGRGRGGYEEGGRGRGGYDQRGRGRGGYEEGGRGRGGGFRGGGSFQYRSREQQAIELLPSRVGLPHDVVTNMILIHLRGATAYLYKTSYEFINGSTEPTDEWKMTAQRRALEACVGEGNKPPSNVVCTGQYLLSPVEIAELHGFSEKYKFGKTEEIRLTATFDGARALQLPADNAFLNAILGEAVMCVYATRLGGSFVDMEQCETPGNDLRLMQKITPKLMQLAGGSTTTSGQKQQQEQQKQQHRDVLQIDVGYSVSSMESCATELHRLASRPATFRKDATLRFAGMKVVSTKPRATMLKVVEVVFDKNVDSAAGMVREPETTFSQYFARRYGLTLQDHKAPVLLCKPVGRRGKACSYPAELLYPMSLTDRQRQMLPQLCSLYPSQRHTMLQAVLKRLRESEAFVKVLRDFGVELPATSSFITCSGEVLAAPTIFIPNGNGHESCNPMLPQNLGQQGFARALSNALRHPNRCPTAVPVADFLVDPNMHGQDRSRLQQLLRKYGVNVPDMTEMVREGRYMSLALPRGKNTPLRLAIQKVDDRGCPMYADAKKEFLLAGVVSQMWKRELKDSIPNMIVQQIAAKLNHFNFVADLGQSVPTLAGQDVLLIGVHSGLSISTESTAKSVMSRRCFVVTFTAFLARGKEWSHYCNHYIRRGKHTTVWKEESGQETSTSSNTSISPKINSTDVIQEHLGKFMNAAIAHFGLHETKKKGTVIVYRGCASDGEVVECAPMVKLLPQVLPNWNYAMITAQPRSHTRFFWQASDALGLCNAPRGFITMLNHDRIYEVSSSVPVKCSFFLTAASCTLGHASNTCFVVLDMKGLNKKEIVQLTYHTCYMYPNKADSLPLPLPMKCALEYARKYQFVTGSDKLLELPPLIRPTMHYL